MLKRTCILCPAVTTIVAYRGAAVPTGKKEGMLLSAKERIQTIRILEKLSAKPELSQVLGLEVSTEQPVLREKPQSDGTAFLNKIF